MNDLLLTAVMIAAVIAFGALISVGNERQRRAIDALHQAYKQWAMQDLRLKRGTVSAQTQIPDLTAWLTKVTSMALGYQTTIMDYQLHSDPIPAVEFRDDTQGTTIVCALESPSTLLSLLKTKRSPLRGQLRSNPLFHVSKRTPAAELSALNAGMMFDIELPVAWNSLTGQKMEIDTLWAYILD